MAPRVLLARHPAVCSIGTFGHTIPAVCFVSAAGELYTAAVVSGEAVNRWRRAWPVERTVGAVMCRSVRRDQCETTALRGGAPVVADPVHATSAGTTCPLVTATDSRAGRSISSFARR